MPRLGLARPGKARIFLFPTTKGDTKMSDAFPLDFDSLQKGDVVPCEKIEAIYQVNHLREPKEFAFGCMTLAKRITDERPDLLARVHDNCVLILTDPQADDWTYSETGRAIRIIARNAKRRAVIDRSGFDEERLRVAESRDKASTLLALMTRKELRRAQREQLLLAAGKNDEAAE